MGDIYNWLTSDKKAPESHRIQMGSRRRHIDTVLSKKEAGQELTEEEERMLSEYEKQLAEERASGT